MITQLVKYSSIVFSNYRTYLDSKMNQSPYPSTSMRLRGTVQINLLSFLIQNSYCLHDATLLCRFQD